jgi:hypothetical protein
VGAELVWRCLQACGAPASNFAGLAALSEGKGKGDGGGGLEPFYRRRRGSNYSRNKEE